MSYMKGSGIFQLSILNTQVMSEGAAKFERLRKKKKEWLNHFLASKLVVMESKHSSRELLLSSSIYYIML